MNSQHRKPNSADIPTDMPQRDAPLAFSTGNDEQETYAALRDLIVGPEKRQLSEIQNRLDDPVQRAEEISRALPDAILLGTARDRRIAEALQPSMDSALKKSVRKNPKALVDAIYPILGPGIRKAVSSILMGMIQSLNRLLDTAFSIRGIKWRLEAIRTRRPFAEIVLLHTLVYQVEQIFLIHRSTGLVLLHVSSPDIASKDPDLVSGMLSAIQEFITDSFPTETCSSLETLRMGEGLSVMIEQSRHALLAAAIRGTPPVEQRDKFRSMLEEIQQKFESALEAFQGDTAPFVILRNRLEEGLEHRVRTDAKRTTPLLWIVCALVVLSLGYLCYLPVHRALLWNDFIQDIKGLSGIVITDYGRDGGKYYISGLKDPLVPDPVNNQAEYPFQESDLIMHWIPYDSMEPALVLKRAEKRLTPPETVQLSFSDGCLTASGFATHAWISSFKRRAETIAGIETINMEGVKDKDVAAIDNAMKRLSATQILFHKESPTPAAGQEGTLERVGSTIEEIQKLSRNLGADVQIVLKGHTDASGTEAYNRRLSKDRADSIIAYMVERGINPSNLTAVGITSEISFAAHRMPKEEVEIKRVVTFETFYNNPEMETDER